jgi:hypothetical protein
VLFCGEIVAHHLHDLGSGGHRKRRLRLAARRQRGGEKQQSLLRMQKPGFPGHILSRLPQMESSLLYS